MKEFKIPKNEVRWETYCNSNEDPIFVITSTPLRDKYFLYEVVGDSLKKIDKSSTPLELEEFARNSKLFK